MLHQFGYRAWSCRFLYHAFNDIELPNPTHRQRVVIGADTERSRYFIESAKVNDFLRDS